MELHCWEELSYGLHAELYTIMNHIKGVSDSRSLCTAADMTL